MERLHPTLKERSSKRRNGTGESESRCKRFDRMFATCTSPCSPACIHAYFSLHSFLLILSVKFVKRDADHTIIVSSTHTFPACPSARSSSHISAAWGIVIFSCLYSVLYGVHSLNTVRSVRQNVFHPCTVPFRNLK